MMSEHDQIVNTIEAIKDGRSFTKYNFELSKEGNREAIIEYLFCNSDDMGQIIQYMVHAINKDSKKSEDFKKFISELTSFINWRANLTPEQLDDINQFIKSNITLINTGHGPLLHIACKLNETNIIDILLTNEKINPNKDRYNRLPPLLEACHAGQAKVVQALIGHNIVDVNIRDYYGISPFALACKKGNYELAKLIIENHKVDVNAASNNGDTPLIYACRRKDFDLIKMMLADSRVNTPAEKELIKHSIDSAIIELITTARQVPSTTAISGDKAMSSELNNFTTMTNN